MDYNNCKIRRALVHLDRTDEPEVFGDVDWQDLFSKMKKNAEENGKEVHHRRPRRVPYDSHANKFYMSEQIFDQAVDDHMSRESCFPWNKFTGIGCEKALKVTSGRFVYLQKDLDNGDPGMGNVLDGKHHLFKVLCGQGASAAKDENGKSTTVMKYAMKQWLMAEGRGFSSSMHHGCFFVVFKKADASSI